MAKKKKDIDWLKARPDILNLLDRYHRQRIEWDAQDARRSKRPVFSTGVIRAYQRDAKRMAARVAKGNKAANASKSSAVRHLSPDEVKRIAAEKGYKTKFD